MNMAVDFVHICLSLFVTTTTTTIATTFAALERPFLFCQPEIYLCIYTRMVPHGGKSDTRYSSRTEESHDPLANLFSPAKSPLKMSESPPYVYESEFCQMVWYGHPPGIVPGELAYRAKTSGLVLTKAFELPVQVVHHDGLVYSMGYTPVRDLYRSLKALIQATMALWERPQQVGRPLMLSRSSMPGRVMPSLDQPPPWAMK